MSVLQSEPVSLSVSTSAGRPFWHHPVFQAVLIAAAFFAAVAPTLPWVDFSGGMENFNVGTALEMLRDGHWLVPTLLGEIRWRKPPLAEWTTAWGILSSGSLAWGARWPTLLAGSLTLAAVYELGRLAGGKRLGAISAIICGTNLLFLKWAREASYDMQLALWVMVTNVFLARAILRGQWWLGCTGAGVALGLALMTKGPPALLQTVVPPLVLLVLWPRRLDQPTPPRRSRLLPAGVGLLLVLIIALPWPLYMMTKMKGLVPGWIDEVRLAQEAQFERRMGGWVSYFAIVPLMLPWAVWFVGGLWVAGGEWIRDRQRRVAPTFASARFARRLLFVWFVVPLAVMWFFPERRDRYLLPLLGPAAVLAGWFLLRYLSALEQAPRLPRWPLALHWVGVAAIGIGVPLAEGFARFCRTPDGAQWLPVTVALAGAAAAGVVLALGARLRRPTRLGTVAATAALMLLVLPQFVWGYARSDKGRSEAKPFVQDILRRYPDAVVYNAVNRPKRNDLPLELVIYLNRVPARAEQPEFLSVIDRPQVIIFPDGTCHPPKSFAPAAPRRRIKGEWWNAYVLPARSRS